MCKVIRYLFACDSEHQAKIRFSKCGGTYYKTRRSGRLTACCADAYINIKYETACGPCQQTEWDAGWKAKLERAKGYLCKMTGKTGEREIANLVSGLETEYQEASWKTRSMFPPSTHLPVRKVETAPLDRMRKGSPLAKELTVEEIESRHGEREEEPDASHFEPMSYDHPLDSWDNSWVDEFLQCGESGETTNEEEQAGFYMEPASYWDSPWPGSYESENRESEETSEVIESETWGGGDAGNSSSNFLAWGSDAEKPSSSAMLGFDGILETDSNHHVQLDEAIRGFWQTVNEDKPEQGTPATNDEEVTNEHPEILECRLQNLDISSDHGCKRPLSEVLSVQYIWTDGATECPSSLSDTSQDLSVSDSDSNSDSNLDSDSDSDSDSESTSTAPSTPPSSPYYCSSSLPLTPPPTCPTLTTLQKLSPPLSGLPTPPHSPIAALSPCSVLSSSFLIQPAQARPGNKYTQMRSMLPNLFPPNTQAYRKSYLEIARQEARETVNKSADPRYLPTPSEYDSQEPKGFWWWEEFGTWMPN